MKKSEFFEITRTRESGIIVIEKDKAIEAVKEDGDALRYVKEQTPDICIEAVKRNGDALQYVNITIFEDE